VTSADATPMYKPPSRMRELEDRLIEAGPWIASGIVLLAAFIVPIWLTSTETTPGQALHNAGPYAWRGALLALLVIEGLLAWVHDRAESRTKREAKEREAAIRKLEWTRFDGHFDLARV
jgi:hypothetical protein